jgi:hypothetical protein
MEPLQLIAFASITRARQRLSDSLPGAPRVPYEPSRRPTVGEANLTSRTWLADVLRRTADRVAPYSTPVHRLPVHKR